MVFDYYRDPAHKVKKTLEHRPDLPVVFFVTHRHHDHFSHEIFDLGQSHKRQYIISNDVKDKDISFRYAYRLDESWRQNRELNGRTVGKSFRNYRSTILISHRLPRLCSRQQHPERLGRADKPVEAQGDGDYGRGKE